VTPTCWHCGGGGGGTGAGGGDGGAGSPAYTSKLTDAKVGGGVTIDGNGVVELTWVPAR